MEQETKTKLLSVLDKCHNTQREIKHIRRLLYVLHEGFRENGFDGNEFGESMSYLLDKLLEIIEKEQLDPMQTTICEIGGFKQNDWK